jgi:hypothetical protein
MASSPSDRSPNANEETAVKRTALGPKNAIVVVADPAPSPVSANLKKQVNKRKILSSDLRKLVSAAGLGCRSPASIGVVTDVVE